MYFLGASYLFHVHVSRFQKCEFQLLYFEILMLSSTVFCNWFSLFILTILIKVKRLTSSFQDIFLVRICTSIFIRLHNCHIVRMKIHINICSPLNAIDRLFGYNVDTWILI